MSDKYTESFEYECPEGDMCPNKEKINELLERLRECEESLGFYADKKNWGGTVSIKEQIVIHPKDHESYKYGGKRARDYFAKYSGDKKND